MSINRKLRITFQPKNKEDFEGKRRFSVGAKSLYKYVGEYNAAKQIEKALNYKHRDDTPKKQYKLRVKLRKFGTIDFYYK